MADIPKNMELFNVVTLRIFDRLYEAFPQPIDITPGSIAIEITADEADSDAMKAVLVADNTLSWLATEGFLRYERPYTGKFPQVVLTLKGLTILGLVPRSIQPSETPETMIKKIKRVLYTGAERTSADAVKSVVTEVFRLTLWP
jgi:hypothetical protein